MSSFLRRHIDLTRKGTKFGCVTLSEIEGGYECEISMFTLARHYYILDKSSTRTSIRYRNTTDGAFGLTFEHHSYDTVLCCSEQNVSVKLRSPLPYFTDVKLNGAPLFEAEECIDFP
jgi:hypothetical protein